MATLVSPIPRSTVIWFGSLEFMSTSFGYDMILLSIKGPEGARIAPARLRAPRRPRHHASPPKKRRGQRRHHSSASSRSPARAGQVVTQEPTTPRAGAAGTTARRHEDRATTMGDDAPRVLLSPTMLLPHGLFAPRRCNIPDVTVTKNGSCHHEHCKSYLLKHISMHQLKISLFLLLELREVECVYVGC